MIANLIVTIKTTRLDLSAAEMFLLIGIMTLAILFRYPRCGLVAAYVFTYRWCWDLVSSFSVQAQLAFAIFGILVGALAVAAMLLDTRKRR